MTPEEREQYVSVRWLDCQLGAEPAADFLRRYRTELSDEIFNEALGAAIREERERCAKIAESKKEHPDQINEKDAYDIAWDVCCTEIAAAIRNGKRAKPRGPKRQSATPKG
jgi:hypothetical protein